MAARDLAFRKYSVAADADMTSEWPLDRRICFIANIRDRFKTKVNKSKPVNKKGIDLDNPFAAALIGLKVKD